MWQVEYSDLAEEAILSFDKPVRQRILKFFRERVPSHPDPKRLAEPLSGLLRGLYRFLVEITAQSVTFKKVALLFWC